jgi:hypothetical protein
MSHNIKTLQNLPTGRLKKLHAKYTNKKTEEASREAKTIKGILKSRMNESTQDLKHRYKKILEQVLPEKITQPTNGMSQHYTGGRTRNAVKAPIISPIKSRVIK